MSNTFIDMDCILVMIIVTTKMRFLDLVFSAHILVMIMVITKMRFLDLVFSAPLPFFEFLLRNRVYLQNLYIFHKTLFHILLFCGILSGYYHYKLGERGMNPKVLFT